VQAADLPAKLLEFARALGIATAERLDLLPQRLEIRALVRQAGAREREHQHRGQHECRPTC
jgi:hypothetical protein